MKKTKKSEELQLLTGFKSQTGIWLNLSSLGILLIVISFFCPYCSYNPTVLDELKRNVEFFDLSYLAMIAVLVLLAAATLAGINFSNFAKTFTADKDWKSKINRYFTFALLTAIIIFIATIIMLVACLLYEIPESNYSNLEIKLSIGFYLFAIGCIFGFFGYVSFFAILRNFVNGRITMEKIVFSKNAKTTVTPEISNTLTNKLNELQKLKDNGIISEEEYQTKKEELLKNYQ